MKVTVTFRLEPAGAFGLPEEGCTVVPVGGQVLSSPVLHWRTGILVGPGTLSKYRPDDEALNLLLEFPDAHVRMQDNAAFVDLDVAKPEQACARAQALIDEMLKSLSVYLGFVLSAEALIVETEDGECMPVPKTVKWTNARFYDIKELGDAVKRSVRLVPIQDALLSRALDYFVHAIFLLDNRERIASPLSRHHPMLLSSIFLNLWKAASTIVGDPSKDKDYQSRYRRFGITREFFADEIEHLRELRNSYDIAHYQKPPEQVADIGPELGRARKTAAKVIQMYSDGLLARDVGKPHND